MEKEINKEKEFLTPSPRAHEKAAGKAKADRNLALQNFEGWCEADFKKQLLRFADRYPIRLLSKFFYYWADRTTDGRMRLQLQQTFDLEKRLAAWASKESNFCKSTGGSNGNTAPAEICSQFALNQEAIPAYPERQAATNGRKAARSFDAFGTPETATRSFDGYGTSEAAARSFDAFGTPETAAHSFDGFGTPETATGSFDGYGTPETATGSFDGYGTPEAATRSFDAFGTPETAARSFDGYGTSETAARFTDSARMNQPDRGTGFVRGEKSLPRL